MFLQIFNEPGAFIIKFGLFRFIEFYKMINMLIANHTRSAAEYSSSPGEDEAKGSRMRINVFSIEISCAFTFNLTLTAG